MLMRIMVTGGFYPRCWHLAIRAPERFNGGSFVNPLHPEPAMRNVALKLFLLTIACLFIVADFVVAQTDPAQLLKSNGLKKIKGRYILAAEDDVLQLYRQTLAATAEANQAIANAGDAAARNQSIIDFQQRIAFDEALRDQMWVEMRDGTSLEEQTTRRAARRDLNIAKQQRALLGQAKARATPKEAKRLADQAQEACKNAEQNQRELRNLISETDGKYKTLAADSIIRKALGESKLGPSDWFKKLAASFGITKKGTKQSGNISSLAKETPKHLTEAVEELKQAADRLRNVKFQKNAKVFEERNRRREDTIKAIEDAIAKLRQGDFDPRLLDKATALNDGYTGSMIPKARDGVKEARERLKKAAGLLRGE
jgi:hypothetical protein